MNSLAPSTTADRSLRIQTLVALAALYVMWSSTYLALRYVVHALPLMLTAGARFLVASALLFGLQRLRGEAPPDRRDWGAAASSGVLLFSVANGLLCVAETRVGSGVAAVACASTPLFVAGIGAALGERPSARDLAGIALGFVGVLVLGAGADLTSAGVRGMLVLASPVAWAFGTVIARRARAASPVTFAAQQMVCGGVAMLVAGVALGERAPASVPAEAWVALAYLVVCGSVLAFPAYVFLVKNARPAVATSYAYVNPVLAVMLGAALGGESLTGSTLVALGLVVAAVLVVATAPRSPGESRARAPGPHPALPRTPSPCLERGLVPADNLTKT